MFHLNIYQWFICINNKTFHWPSTERLLSRHRILKKSNRGNCEISICQYYASNLYKSLKKYVNSSRIKNLNYRRERTTFRCTFTAFAFQKRKQKKPLNNTVNGWKGYFFRHIAVPMYSEVIAPPNGASPLWAEK